MNLFQLNWIWMSLIAALFVGITPVFLKGGLKKTNVIVSTAIFSTAFWVTNFIYSRMNGVKIDIESLSGDSFFKLLGMGLLLCVAIFTLFIALDKGSVIQVLISTQLVNAAVLVISLVVNRMKPNTNQLVYILLIIAGFVVIIVSEKNDRAWAIFAFVSVIVFAASKLYQNKLLTGIDENMIMNWSALIATIITWIIFFVKKEGKALKSTTIFHAFFLIAAGVLLALGLVLNKVALATGDVTMVQSLYKLMLPIAVLFSVAALREKINTMKIVALVLVIVANYCVSI
ncbi:MAG: EamA family transporter [Lachnospiraceae bacterium]|nr:EamA family transporter [Lachnospiraceae bacterium]